MPQALSARGRSLPRAFRRRKMQLPVWMLRAVRPREICRMHECEGRSRLKEISRPERGGLQGTFVISASASRSSGIIDRSRFIRFFGGFVQLAHPPLTIRLAISPCSRLSGTGDR
jgi:hypothetical protein